MNEDLIALTAMFSTMAVRTLAAVAPVLDTA